MIPEGIKNAIDRKEYNMRTKMKTCLLLLCACTIATGFQSSGIPMKLHFGIQTIPCQSHTALAAFQFQALSKERQEELTEIVARGLTPVFFGRDVRMNKIDNLRNVSPSNCLVTAEKALKMILRDYQKELSVSKNSGNPDAFEERQQTRKFLSDLLLGTSIMRIRHYYTLVAMLSKQGQYDDTDLIDPTHDLCLEDLGSINGVDIISSVKIRTTELCPTLTVDDHTKELKLSRAMVRVHLQEMQGRGKHSSAIESVLSDFLSSLKDPAHQICVRYSLPLFFVQLLIDQYGSTLTEKISKTFNAPGPITIRRNAMRCRTDKQLQSLLSKNGIRIGPIVPARWDHRNATNTLHTTYFHLVPDEYWSPSTSSIWSQSLWKEGYFEVQDAGSQFIVQSIEPTFADGEYVAVDYCAGNGGKSLALASHIRQHQAVQSHKTRDKGSSVKATIVAHDIVADRLKQLEGSLLRVGLEEADSGIQLLVTTNLTDLANKRRYSESFADLVLVDAPCSSTGVLRRRPSQRFQLKEDEIKNKFPELQLFILQEASKLVRAGGTLVYATCSICDFENEQVAARFEASSAYHGGGKLWRPLCFQEIHDQTSVEGLRHCCNLLPIGFNSSDGFFVARWTRVK